MTRGERFTPFLAFPPELRRVIYTTNSIESLNYQLRKVTQEPRPLPQRSRGRQTALAGDLRHRRQTSARPGERAKSPHRATQSTRTPRRGPGHDELETGTATALTGLPRPHQPPPLTTMTANAYTKNLTGSGRAPAPVGESLHDRWHAKLRSLDWHRISRRPGQKPVGDPHRPGRGARHQAAHPIRHPRQRSDSHQRLPRQDSIDHAPSGPRGVSRDQRR